MINTRPTAFDHIYDVAMWPRRHILPIAEGILDSVFCPPYSPLENPYLPPPAGLAVLLLESWGGILIGGTLIALTLPSLAAGGLLKGTRAFAGQAIRRLRSHRALPGNIQSDKLETAPRTPAGFPSHLSARGITKPVPTVTTAPRQNRTPDGQVAAPGSREIQGQAPRPAASPRQGTSLGD